MRVTVLPGAGGATTRRVGALAAGLAALGAAAGGALLTGPASEPALAVATLSGRAAAALQGLGAALPLGYAFGAGMAAAFNPCGFALLPAYLALYLGTAAEGRQGGRSVARALLVGGTMTAGFVALFGLAGLALGLVAVAAAGLLPWLGLLVGVGLVVAGARMLAGADLRAASAERLGAGVGRRAARRDVLGYAAYGVAFGLSSLGCTLPLFVTVVGTALAGGGLGAAAGQLVLYALGMGAVVTAATLAVALFGPAVVERAGAVGRYLAPASAILLLLTGAYVVHYWLTAGGLLA